MSWEGPQSDSQDCPWGCTCSEESGLRERPGKGRDRGGRQRGEERERKREGEEREGEAEETERRVRRARERGSITIIYCSEQVRMHVAVRRGMPRMLCPVPSVCVSERERDRDRDRETETETETKTETKTETETAPVSSSQ